MVTVANDIIKYNERNDDGISSEEYPHRISSANILSEYSQQISSGRGSGIHLVQHHRTFSGSPREDEFEVIYLSFIFSFCVGLGGGIKIVGVDGINEIVSPA